MSRARKIQLGIAVTLAVAAATLRIFSSIGGYKHATTPSAEGYHDFGTVNGTTFWLRSAGSDQFSLRTTGNAHGTCRYSGPELGSKLSSVFGANGYLELCNVGVLGRSGLIAYLVPDTYGPAHVELSDGTTASQAGSIDASALLPNQHIDVIDITNAAATVVSTSFG